LPYLQSTIEEPMFIIAHVLLWKALTMPTFQITTPILYRNK
jgi:hypothetical protein